MCRAVPALIKRIEGEVAWVEEEGVERPVSILSFPDLQPGDYIFHHAGLALQRLDPDEAREILSVYAELEQLMAEEW